MKKVLVCALSAIVLTAGVSSCGKTTKGKISEDWNVTSIVENSSSTSGGTTTTSSSTTTVSGNAITTTTTSGGSTNTDAGTVNKYQFIVNKDGSYERNEDITYSETNSGTTQTKNYVFTEKGTWSFVGKNKSDDFKKNERVVFNTTSYEGKTTVTYTNSGVTTTSNGSYSGTFLVGENSTIYNVDESTSKKLVLTSESNSTNSSTNSSGTTSSSADSGKTTITLEKP